MARTPRRLILEDKSFFHVTWKCHNSDFLLASIQAKRKLYDLLLRYKNQHHIKIYGYCFMDNHPHIVGYCETVTEFSKFFQVVNACLARFINHELGRKGQVVMDRPHSPRIESERYLLQVLKYLDENPVKAGLVKEPDEYRWSSCRALAHGVPDPLLDPLPEAHSISHEAYRSFFRLSKKRISDGKEIAVQMTTQTYFLGSIQWSRRQKQNLLIAKQMAVCHETHSQSEPLHSTHPLLPMPKGILNYGKR